MDLGYRGVDHLNPDVRIVHLKADHRLDPCHLKAEEGDRLHAVPCAAGYNICWLLRAIARQMARGRQPGARRVAGGADRSI